MGFGAFYPRQTRLPAHFVKHAIDVGRLKLHSAATLDDDMRIQSELWASSVLYLTQ
jgi:hypothetical protein